MQATSSYPGSTTAGTAPYYYGSGGDGGGSSSSSSSISNSLHHHNNNNNNNNHSKNGSTARAIACKNNEALQYFLRGDFDTSIDLLKEAYGIFASFRHHYYLNLLQIQHMQHHIPSMYDAGHGGDGSLLLATSAATVATMTMGAAKECNNLNNQGIDMEVDDDGDLDRTSRKDHKYRATPPSQHQPPRSSSPSPSVCPSASSMYNRAFVLATDEDDMTLLITNERQTGAVLLYNLGLVYHNVGYYQGVSAAIPHSIQLYQWSLSFLDLPSFRTTMDSSYQGLDCDLFNVNSTTVTMHDNLPGSDVFESASGNGAGRRSKKAKTNKRRYGDRQFQEQQRQSLPNHHPNHQEDPKLMLAVLNNLSNLFTYLHRIPETLYALYRLRVVLAASAMTHLAAIVASSSAASSNSSITNGSNNSPNNAEDSARTMITNGDDDYNWFFINALFQGKELNFAPAA